MVAYGGFTEAEIEDATRKVVDQTTPEKPSSEDKSQHASPVEVSVHGVGRNAGGVIQGAIAGLFSALALGRALTIDTSSLSRWGYR